MPILIRRAAASLRKRGRETAEKEEARVSIGILGGGQLGYMLALAGYPLGLRFRFLDPSPEAPVGRIAPRVTGDYTDRAALEKFAHGLAVVTYEFENVPVDAATFGQEGDRFSAARGARNGAGPPERKTIVREAGNRHDGICFGARGL